MTRIEKLGMALLAILLATLLFLMLSIGTAGQEEQACHDMCAFRDSEIRLYEPGVCICKK